MEYPRFKLHFTIISFISQQLQIDAKLFIDYWKDSVWKAHLASIRKFTNFTPIENDSQKLVKWLIDEVKKIIQLGLKWFLPQSRDVLFPVGIEILPNGHLLSLVQSTQNLRNGE